MTNTALDDNSKHLHQMNKRELSNDFDKYAVTCYICVNVSDNLICNQFAIDRPCRPGKCYFFLQKNPAFSFIFLHYTYTQIVHVVVNKIQIDSF